MSNTVLCTIRTSDLVRALAQTSLGHDLHGDTITIEYRGHKDTGFALLFDQYPIWVSEQSHKERTYTDVPVDALRHATQSGTDTVVVADENSVLVVGGIRCVTSATPLTTLNAVQTISTIVEKSPNGVKTPTLGRVTHPVAQTPAYRLLDAAMTLSAFAFGSIRARWNVRVGGVDILVARDVLIRAWMTDVQTDLRVVVVERIECHDGKVVITQRQVLAPLTPSEYCRLFLLMGVPTP